MLGSLFIRTSRSLSGVCNSSSKARSWFKTIGEPNSRYLVTSCRNCINEQAKENNGLQAEDDAHSSSVQLNERTNITNKLEFIEPKNVDTIAEYSVLNDDGSLAGQLDASLSDEKILQLYKGMIILNTMDRVMFDSHRQGRISFYMTSFGEEAAQLGSAGALQPSDWVFAQYREAGVLIHRQVSLRALMAQCFGNKEDSGKGRQMPIHFGSRELNYVTISSTLATQMPQAAGSAYAFKQHSGDRVAACYFGEGASSEGDAHAAMNFAATLECPVVFFCRNNGYAISTPTREQYRGDGIVSRGLGYGIVSIRVDGNDLLAVYAATRAARHLAATRSQPVLVEAMTYRLGHHSTSDDSSAYRNADEARLWNGRTSALQRVLNYLLTRDLWSEEREQEARLAARTQVLEALTWAENLKKPAISSMFDDVYDELPRNLLNQRQELQNHLQQYADKYPSINEHEPV